MICLHIYIYIWDTCSEIQNKRCPQNCLPRWESKDLCQFYHVFFLDPPPNTCFQKFILAKDSPSSNTCCFPHANLINPIESVCQLVPEQRSNHLPPFRYSERWTHQSIIASKASKVRELQIVVGKLAQSKWSEKNTFEKNVHHECSKSMNSGPLY